MALAGDLEVTAMDVLDTLATVLGMVAAVTEVHAEDDDATSDHA